MRMDTCDPPLATDDTARRCLRGAARVGGTVLIVLGALLLLWSLLVWRWQDPFTATFTWWEQRGLADRYAQVAERYRADPPPAADGRRVPLASVAGTFRADTAEGEPIGRLRVARLGLNTVMVNGTDSATLKRGPGRDPRTFMPGEDELVYVAGHRTTFGAPFADIDALRPGDRIVLELPYGTFTYVARRHSIVDASDLSVLRSRGREQLALQACHPRFFATERYIVWADLERVALPAELRRSVRVGEPR